jgi:hypothetical protein
MHELHSTASCTYISTEVRQFLPRVRGSLPAPCTQRGWPDAIVRIPCPYYVLETETGKTEDKLPSG